MLGMDPVLTGSLCFLVLAVVMYVKFIREHPMSEEELRNHRAHHHHRQSSVPIEPDMVPFLDPVSSPLKVLQQQKKQPLSPPRHVIGGNGSQEQDIYKHGHQPQRQQQQHGYYHAVKHPMRRRAHSAATTAPHPHLLQTIGAPPMTIIDAEMGLSTVSTGDSVNDGRREDMRYSDAYEPIDIPSGPHSSSYRIDFGGMEFEDHEASFAEHQHGYHTLGELDDLENRQPLAKSRTHEISVQSPVEQNHCRRLTPAPFMIGGLDGDGTGLDEELPSLVTPTKQQHHHDQHQQDQIKTVAMERQFVRDVAPPAQMQLEVARKARIPLFLHSPMYVKTSTIPAPDGANPIEPYQPHAQQQLKQINLQDDHGYDQQLYSPRKMHDKLPPKCHKNYSLHIDFQELRIGDMIGQGAFGTVHRATWRGTTVAVKILVCQQLTSDILAEFETEVQIMSILRHPNICLLMGACLDPPSRCLVVEYLPRGSLWNVLRQDVVIDAAKQITFARDTALGMNYLHSFQPPILHRDLKSPNLLVDLSYAIKISDFGLARVRAHFQTMTGNCGTTQWMAPEVLAAEKYTEKADVFSYGVVCWEIITHACPYDGLCQIQAALGVLNNNLRPTIPADCPPLFKKLMTLCWVSNPELRPTFEQILELVQHLNDETYLNELAPPPHHG